MRQIVSQNAWRSIEVDPHQQNPQQHGQQINRQNQNNRNQVRIRSSNGLYTDQHFWSKVRALLIISFSFFVIAVLIFGLTQLGTQNNNELTGKNKTQIVQNKGQLYRQENPIKLTQQLTPMTKDEIKINKNLKKSYFVVPKKIWRFVSSQNQKNYVSDLIQKNQQMVAQKSGFEIHQINKNNYKNYMNKQVGAKIQVLSVDFQSTLSQINSTFLSQKNRATQASKIIQYVIMMQVLLQNGGIVIDKQLLLTQSLEWLQKIDENPYVNRDLRSNGTEVFAFYDLNQSSAQFAKNYNTNFDIVKPYRMLKQLPGMTIEFVAALPDATFIKQLCKYMMNFLQNPHKQFEQRQNNQKLMEIFQTKKNQFKNSNTLTFSALRILIHQVEVLQKQVHDKKGNIHDQVFNYFRLSLMNSAYGPQRLHYLLRPPVQCQQVQLAQLFLQETQETLGKIRYCTFLPRQIRNSDFFQKIKNKIYKITKGSFLHRICFDGDDNDHLIDNKQKPPITDPQGPQWVALPKKLWIIWDTGFEGAHLANQLMIKNLIKKAKQSGVDATLVTNANIHEYLDKQTLDKIDNALKQAKVQTFPQYKSDLWRIALIYKHGGIYMDASTILVQKLDWLFYISRLQSNFIWNRYSALPKAVFSFHFLHFHVINWKVDQEYNTKSGTTLWTQNSFFAAQPQHELIRDWFDLFIKLIQLPYDQTYKLLKETGLWGVRMTAANWSYLLPQQLLRLAVNMKQKELDSRRETKWKNANHYYGAWYLPKVLGMIKFTFYPDHIWNLDQPEWQSQTFFDNYSQEYAEGLVGKVHFFAKLHEQSTRKFYLNMIQNQNYLREMHPDSLFHMHLLSHGERLIKVNNKFMWNFAQKDL